MAATGALLVDLNAESPDLEALRASLAHGDDVERVAAALLIAECGCAGHVAVADLSVALDAGNGREVRWACAYSLGRIGSAARPAVPALMRALSDVDADVREEAGRALDRIIGA